MYLDYWIFEMCSSGCSSVNIHPNIHKYWAVYQGVDKHTNNP